MDLADALGSGGGGPWPSGGSNQPGGGGVWPGGNSQPPTNPTWPGPNPAWPGQAPNQPTWPAQPGGAPNQPTWPAQPGGAPNQPTWPAQPGGAPNQPTWPAQPGGAPNQPTWPAQPGGAPNQPTWPAQPGGAPNQPTWPGPAAPAGQQTSVAVPYKQNLPNGVFDKLLITINGTVNPKANMFTLDMSTGSDVAFHFNPRFNEGGKKVIVRNSRTNNKWGKEERQLSGFPFVEGQSFKMKILCTNKEFRVAVNGSHLLEYHHRIQDLSSIVHLSIYKDLTLSSVQMERLP